jgi:hypothetical protein
LLFRLVWHFTDLSCSYSDKDTEKVGSVAIAEMLDRTNLIAIVSGGNYPIIAPNSGKYMTNQVVQSVLKMLASN